MKAPGAILRERLAKGALVVPGAYDVASAILAQRAGFEAVLLGSYAISPSMIGLPDLGLLSDTEMCALVQRCADALNIPIIADVDTGYNGGGVVNVISTVRKLEHAGASCLQIEDQTSPKKAGMTPGRTLIPIDEMVAKVRAAIEHRKSPDLLVMARTDASPIEPAIERIQAYEAAGADIVFIEDYASVDDIRKATRSVEVPLVYCLTEGGPMPDVSVEELADLGVGIIYFPVTALGAALRAVSAAFETIKLTGRMMRTGDSVNPYFGEIADVARDDWWRTRAEALKSWERGP